MADARQGERVVEHRRADLDAERTIVVRDSTPADLDGLAAMYGRLSADDRFRRFFAGGQPSRRFLERWVRLAEAGGIGLVAVLERRGPAAAGGPLDAEQPIVGEAGCWPLPNGDGELGLAVDPAWRGWLGPYLLDALIEAARELGVRNLEADVLIDNRPMLSVINARGAAEMGRPDWSIVRMVVSTSGPAPTWPDETPGGRPRLLVETTARQQAAGAAAAGAPGWQVLTCAGPASRPGGRCPLLVEGRCPLAAGADAVVLALPPEDPATAQLAAAHAAHGAALTTGPPSCVAQLMADAVRPAIPEEP
ncbi:MAG: N-acetyltransferase family protein [Acidimicrobiales bacterium]